MAVTRHIWILASFEIEFWEEEVPTPQEYQNKIKGFGFDTWEGSRSTRLEAESTIREIANFRRKIKKLRSSVIADIAVVQEDYRKRTKKWNTYSRIYTNSSKKRHKEKIADLESSYASYQKIENIFISLLDQFDNTDEELKRFLKEEEKDKRVNYQNYIASPEWRVKAQAAKERAGQRCQVCNKSRDDVQLDAHHRTYERLGNELESDITVLCRDCHQLYEDRKKAERRRPAVKGSCVRCGTDIALKPTAPYCQSCFLVWKRFSNWEYKEKFCHICKAEKKTSRRAPACYPCYKKHKHKLEFPKK